MKFLVVFVAVLAVSSAQYFGSGAGNPFRNQARRPAARPPAPVLRPAASNAVYSRVSPGNDASANIVRYDSDVNPDGSYNYAYETDNGIAAQEQGSVVNLGGNPPAVAVKAQGSFSFTSPEGIPVSLSYIADENGFQPSSDILPVAPPVPPQILRALEYNAKYVSQRKK